MDPVLLLGNVFGVELGIDIDDPPNLLICEAPLTLRVLSLTMSPSDSKYGEII